MGAACCKEGPESPVEKLENPGALAMSEYGSEKDRQDVVRDMRSEHGQQREPEPERESGAPEFSVSIVGARGLRLSDWQPRVSEPTCYCEVKANGRALFSTAESENPCEPVWAATFDVFLAGSPLEFAVYGEGSDLLGTARLEAEDYAEDGFNGELKLEEAKADGACIRVKVKLAGKDLPPGPAASFSARFERQSADVPWAIVFDDCDGVQLRVLKISDGAISEHNRNAKPQQQVSVGDYLMEVNGVVGRADLMLAEFKNRCSVGCVISRTVTCKFLVDFGDASIPKGIDIAAAPDADFWVIKSIEKNGKGKGQLQPSDRVVAIGSAKHLKAEPPQKIKEAISGKVVVTVQRPAAGRGRGNPPHWAFE
eukprot:CAMPEP_0175409510 /NCGR_PEP_ID=MMETSP0095-20121207/41141_1 /TAXON_ID=311494 /ORGANISM="Alexandrium monilatum, Strain CCMP3105" /LENGTH=367 /DNA_ID=CAMNT_0016708453 /DNA_START=83 /DNA_END=1186 /DNA_ORIENTATION=-